MGTIAVLYFGRDVFLPLAIALLLTFALAPVTSRLRKLRIPRVPAVLTTVMLAFVGIGLFASVTAVQISDLARNIPTYQSNVLVKIRAFKETGAGSGLIEQVTGAIERVGEEIEEEAQAATAPPEEPESEPLPVTIVSRPGPVEILQNLIVPLLSPLASVGLVIVVVIFMLLEREDLRDRFIRLVGSGDLHRTTEALQDAGKWSPPGLTDTLDLERRVSRCRERGTRIRRRSASRLSLWHEPAGASKIWPASSNRAPIRSTRLLEPIGNVPPAEAEADRVLARIRG